VVDSKNVYFTANGGVFETPIAVGTTSQLASGGANLIAIDESNVYWTTSDHPGSGYVMQLAKGGGKAITLATSSGYAYGVAVDSSSVYWTEWGPCGPSCMEPVGAIVKVPIGGGAMVTLACSQTAPTELALDAVSVY
jgi:hypothetical protein